MSNDRASMRKKAKHAKMVHYLHEIEPLPVEGFELPLLLNKEDMLKARTGNRFPQELEVLAGHIYCTYVEPQIQADLKTRLKQYQTDKQDRAKSPVKKPAESNMKFIVQHNQTVLEGKIQKPYRLLPSRVTMIIKGCISENPASVEHLIFQNRGSIFTADKFKPMGKDLAQNGVVAQKASDSPMGLVLRENAIMAEHPTKEMTARIWNHALYLNNALKTKEAKVEVRPIDSLAVPKFDI